MPKLSDSMEEATIIRWLKAPGEPFVRGEPLAEIETDKATIVYEAEADGVIAELLVDEGGTARLGAPIARLNGDGAAAAAPARPRAPRARRSPARRPRPAAYAKAAACARRPSRGGARWSSASPCTASRAPGPRRPRDGDRRRARGAGRASLPGAPAATVARSRTIALTSTQATIARRMEVSRGGSRCSRSRPRST